MARRRSVLWGRRGVLIFLATTVVACRQPKPAEVQPPTELVIGFPEANSKDPEFGPSQFTRMLSQEGLISSVSPDGRPLPRLAESFHWENDGLRLRLSLRRKVYFHDGTLMTASVLAKVLEAAMAKGSNQSSYSSMRDIVAVRPDGEYELLIDLSQPSAFLLDDLDMPLSLPAEPLSPAPEAGTGPFRVVTKTPSEVVFESFDRYYQGAPTIKRVHLKAFDTLRTGWSSLLRGEVDMVTDVPAEAVEFIRSSQVDVLQYKRRYQYMLAFNSRQAPFRSPTVRRALNLSVDRAALIQRALGGYGAEATGPLWPRHWAYDNSISPFAFDPDQAAALFDRAGLPRGGAGASSPVEGARFKFTCLLVGEFSLHERIGLELQKQLYDIGVDMQFEVVSLDEYNQRIPRGQFQAVLVDIISGPSFARPYIFWRSAKTVQGFNVFGYENGEAERLFERLRAAALNEPAFRSATNRLQRVLLEDPPALFLAWSERARVVGPKFKPEIDPERDPILTIGRWKPNPTQVTLGR